MTIRKPLVKRVPITNENLLIDSCKKDGHGLDDYPFFAELLYDRIIGIVRTLSHRYKDNSINQVDDLIHDCMVRIWSKRSDFDPTRGRVSTWVWYVCTSVLNSDFRASKRFLKTMKRVETRDDDSEEDGGSSFDEMFCADELAPSQTIEFRAAIDDLYNRHKSKPRRKEMLDALFMVDTDGVFIANVQRAAFRLAYPGCKFTADLSPDDAKPVQKITGELTRFIREFVRPVFAKHLKGESNV
jgi:DNA-directed RNA polymerase specialized sigma24 family protein